MSIARQIVAGRVYLVTRRCCQRTFLLRPDAATNRAFLYCMGVAAQKAQVNVLFTVAMSNHYHAGISDVHGGSRSSSSTFTSCWRSIKMHSVTGVRTVGPV